MKKGQIKINLADIFDMKSRSEADAKMMDSYHAQSINDHRKIKELEDTILTLGKQIEDERSNMSKIGKNPFLYVGTYFIASNDHDRVSEAQFNAAFKKLLEETFKSKKGNGPQK